MREQSVVLEGVVGSDAQRFSVHRHHTGVGSDRYLACIGLRDGCRLIWQEIEMTSDMAVRSSDIWSAVTSSGSSGSCRNS